MGFATLDKVKKPNARAVEPHGAFYFVIGGSVAVVSVSVFLFLECCSAKISHARDMATMVRLASGCLNLWASSRHFSAFNRYLSKRSSLAMIPNCVKE